MIIDFNYIIKLIDFFVKSIFHIIPKNRLKLLLEFIYGATNLNEVIHTAGYPIDVYGEHKGTLILATKFL